MESSTKILIGAGVTALLAWGSHAMMGKDFIDRLENRVEAKLQDDGTAGVDVAMERDPALRRIVILSGDKTPDERAKIIAAVKAMPGVADARWATDGAVMAAEPAAAAAKVEAPATQEAVAECQKDINALMAGKTINFQSGSAYLAENNTILDEVAAALKPCVGTSVEVQGHTDLVGGAEINQKLSQARAESVVAALVAKGVPAQRMTAKGYGMTQPLENARNAEANAKNRRTVFSIAAASAAAPEGGQ
ncbi:MAG: OmpA family protein [Sphingorhabdus sp.]